MTNSVRTRVALLYTLLFGVLSLLLGFGVYTHLQADAYRRLDKEAGTLLNIVVSEVHQEFTEHGGKQPAEQSLRDFLSSVYQTSFPQEQVAVWQDKTLVAYKSNLGRGQSDLRHASLPRHPASFNSGDLRIVTTDVYQPSVGATYRVAVSTWRGDTLNDLAALSRGLTLLIPLALLFTAAGAVYLARRTLSPLTEMAAAVERITPRNLADRLPVPASPDEISRLAVRFNNLLQRLEQAFVQQQRFMADAAHELRTPVSAALTAAQVTLREQTRSSADYREALQIVEEQMLRLRRIVDDMFVLARADQAFVPLRQEAFYLDELIGEACRAMRLLAARFQVQLHLQQPLPEALCYGDSDLIRQALIALLDNGCKYNRPGGNIQVSLAFGSNQYHVRIADTGSGIPPEAAGDIFDRFYRLDTARSSQAGSGLGLSIARSIAEQHGGSLVLEHSGPSGSTFTLSLPRSQASSASLASD